MGQFILNGRNYSGVTYANGCFIDTDNIIASGSYSGSFSYTATEDCFFYGQIANNSNNSASIQIDGNEVFMIYDSSVNQSGTAFALKKGQTISLITTFSGASVSYRVYGIQQGSPVTFLSEYASACYDTNEREVGCWIDGKPLYAKTINFGTLPNNTTKTVSHGVANVDKIWIAGGFAYQPNGDFVNQLSLYVPNSNAGWYFGVSSANIECYTVTDRTNYSAFVVLYYTKTTDVAGSGKLTTTGMPTVHYDDTERIIGTWFGETLYQKTVVYNNPTLGRVDDLPHNIANIDTITNVEWVALESSGSAIVGHENNDSNWWADFFVVNRTGVSYRIGGSWGVTKIVVTIQYTKTT